MENEEDLNVCGWPAPWSSTSTTVSVSRFMRDGKRTSECRDHSVQLSLKGCLDGGELHHRMPRIKPVLH